MSYFKSINIWHKFQVQLYSNFQSSLIMPSQVVQAYPPSNLFPFGNCNVVLLDLSHLSHKHSSFIFIHWGEFGSIHYYSSVDSLQTTLNTIHDVRPLLPFPPDTTALCSILQSLQDSWQRPHSNMDGGEVSHRDWMRSCLLQRGCSLDIYLTCGQVGPSIWGASRLNNFII